MRVINVMMDVAVCMRLAHLALRVGDLRASRRHDARADVANAGPETPLKCRGLVAVQMSAEELPERLRAWLSGGGR